MQELVSLQDCTEMISPNNVTEAILREEDIWNFVVRFTEDVLRAKKVDLEYINIVEGEQSRSEPLGRRNNGPSSR